MLEQARIVLVADDEALVRRLATRVLENAGYQVLEAADGLEAVALFVERQDQIALVLLDVNMPGLSGEAVVARVRELDPDVAIILSSGYPHDAVSEPNPRTAFIQKPYSPSDLVALANALVDL